MTVNKIKLNKLCVLKLKINLNTMKQTVIISAITTIVILVVATQVNNARVKKGKPSLFK